MTLSGKTVRLLAVVAACGVVASWLVQRLAVYPEFERVEREEATQEVRRCVGALRYEVESLTTLTADYARWDDSWNFMETRSPAFIESNLLVTTFTQTPLTLIGFYDREGRAVWRETRDEETGDVISLSRFPPAGLEPGDPLLDATRGSGRVTGILETETGPLLVAAVQVTRTGGTGPVRGVVVMGRRLSPTLLGAVARRLNASFELVGVGVSGLDPARLDALRDPDAADVEVLDDSMVAHAGVADLDGRMRWLVRVRTAREISGIGADASAAATALHVLLGAVILWVIHRRLRVGVIVPVASISAAVREIAESGDHGRRVPEDGPDEVGRLGSDINRMLARLAAVEADLTRAKETAEAAVAAKSRFLASMSHEVRTPMIGVLGMADHLVDTGLEGESRECAEMVRRSAHMMLAVLDDVLDAAKIEAGRLTLTEGDVDPRAVAEAVAEIAAWPAHAKGLRLVCDVDPSVPRRVRGDALRLRQSLLNLASNAVKFTPRGDVVIRVTAGPARGGAATVRFEVRDTGPGISGEDVARLFQPFSQLGSATGAAQRVSGTGLGLALVREFATRMGGEAGVDSRPGAGSTFWFTAVLPVAEAPAPAVPAELAGVRVLIVAEGEDEQRAIRDAVHDWAPDAASADGVAAAADLARAAAAERRPFDVAVVSQRVADGTAEDAARAVRDASPRTAVVGLVPMGRVSEAASAAPAFSDFADLPVRAAQLAERSARAMERRASPAARPAARTARPAWSDTGDSGPPRTPARTPSAANPPMDVLLVEDNPTNSQLVQLILRKRGYVVGVAVNGAEAVEMVKARRWDVVLMDSQMPVMDGVEATRRIRADEGAGRRTPIVALTANAMPGERDRFTQAGCDAFVPKPFEVAQLIGALERFRPKPAGSAPTA